MTRRLALAGLTLTVAVGVGGCGGDTDAESPAPSSSVSETAGGTESSESADPSASPSASETAATGGAAAGDTYADVAPATGTALSSAASTVNVPADWDGTPTVSGDASIVNGPTPDYSVTIVESNDGEDTSLDGLVADVREFESFDPDAKRLDDIVLAGQPAYHFSGVDPVFEDYVDKFGFSLGGRTFAVAVSTPTDLDQASRDALIGTVLASYRLTGA